ncbi:small subunit ribosomal protein S17 [Terrimicrobium sacchariphilum]|uniref:Small ribosomal subunit protein uS17 n=1 Tax=Terrimicrobium sacchariphilum TaxID=690879 RepID=A0A146GBW1_TERSA|nr:30S ribosomal protein S17 [Terrimicrobium sacchariphilum]GAT34860.1 small subunit ribosomal protein S17 [Terrimicrobium sacchariphilum]
MSEEVSNTTTAPERERNLRKTRVGEVVSSAMDKTIVVRTVTRVPHPKFGKITKMVKKFYVHDEKNEAKVGDRVSIAETRPLSRLKRWRLVEILKH